MFDIVWSLVFDFINMLKWYIPFMILFGVIGNLIREGGRK